MFDLLYCKPATKNRFTKGEPNHAAQKDIDARPDRPVRRPDRGRRLFQDPVCTRGHFPAVFVHGHGRDFAWRGLRRALAAGVRAHRPCRRADLRAGRRLFLCAAADVRLPARPDPVRVRHRQACKAAADVLAHGARDAGGSGCPLRRRRAVSGADRQRVSRQGTDVLAGAQKRHAHLPAGRSAEDRLRQLPLRGDHAPSAAAVRRAAGGIRAAVPPL